METCESYSKWRCPYGAMKKAIYENRAMPSAIISPDEVIGEEERDRLEAQ